MLWYEQVAHYDFQVATSYYGYGQTERHFGLGTRTNVDVVVQFPSGRVTRMNNVAANQTIQVLESAARSRDDVTLSRSQQGMQVSAGRLTLSAGVADSA